MHGSTLVRSHAPDAIFDVGTTTATYTATDTSGRTGSCSFTVTVTDAQAPMLACPASMTVPAAPGQCSAAVTWSAPGPTDNCAVASLTSNFASGDVFPVGTTTVSYTATDVNGRSSTCDFSVEVVDQQNPVISACAADVTLPANSNCQAAIPNLAAQAQASDNCGSVNITQSPPPPGTLVSLGVTEVTITATDGAGRTATCTRHVTVTDTSAPSVTAGATAAMLWPPNHFLVNVGLSVTTSDACSTGGSLVTSVAVYADEEDEDPTGDGNHSPDAKNIGAGTLRLRAERHGDRDGRVYLIVVQATDAAGNVARKSCTAVVPHSQNVADRNSVLSQAAAAKAYFDSHGTPPAGFFVVGDGPIIGPNQ